MDLPAAKLAASPRSKQFVKFCLVGGSGVLLDMALLHILVEHWDWNVSWGKLCSAEAALLNNFLWNEVWTFRTVTERQTTGVLGRLIRFHLICGMGIVWAILLLYLFHVPFGFPLLVANAIAIGLVTIWNFWMNAWFNWTSQV